MRQIKIEFANNKLTIDADANIIGINGDQIKISNLEILFELHHTITEIIDIVNSKGVDNA